MGSIQERTNSKGEKSFTATLRMKGHATACKTFTRKIDAKAWVIQEKAKIQRGIHLDISEAQKRTVSDAIERFIKEEILHTNRGIHLHRWKASIGNYFLSAITEVKINDVTSAWKVLGPSNKRLKCATVNRHLDSLSVVFQAALRWGWARENPVRKARRFQEPLGRIRYLTEIEREKLFVQCRKSKYRPLELVVLLALSTGMRKEELLSMQWSQVDLINGTLILLKTKNNTSRRVYIRGQSLRLFREHAKVRQLNSPYVFPGKKPSSKKPDAARPANERHFDIRKAWEKALEDAEICDFRFHDLRHSCASYLAMNGATALEIAEVLGHRGLDTVKRYAHLSDTHTASVVERMNVRFLGGSNG